MAQTIPDVSVKTVLITGGSGLVGTQLSGMLEEIGYTVTHLSRKAKEGKYKTYEWDVKKEVIDEEAITTADAIIHLAGAGVADRRWDDSRKKEIYDSRINSTKLLHRYVKEHNPNLSYFLSASAIGFYGWDSGSQLVDETSPKGEGFLADVVADWEEEVTHFGDISVPFGMVRVGIVLSNQGGALLEIGKPIKLGAGAPLGPGSQYMSWIHIDDLCRIFIHCLEEKIDGVVNGVAPNAVSNKELTKAMAKKLRRPLILPNVPKFALRILVGEMADMLVGGNNVSSKKIENLGFTFKYPELGSALEELL